mmetsp:Transcript_37474/g.94023  ORF Transcript_37474/g.94023 Transcript_37474/m.94023 type:complete len:244 (-) Transcript_37474:767-1498(-)
MVCLVHNNQIVGIVRLCRPRDEHRAFQHDRRNAPTQGPKQKVQLIKFLRDLAPLDSHADPLCDENRHRLVACDKQNLLLFPTLHSLGVTGWSHLLEHQLEANKRFASASRSPDVKVSTSLCLVLFNLLLLMFGQLLQSVHQLLILLNKVPSVYPDCVIPLCRSLTRSSASSRQCLFGFCIQPASRYQVQQPLKVPNVADAQPQMYSRVIIDKDARDRYPGRVRPRVRTCLCMPIRVWQNSLNG